MSTETSYPVVDLCGKRISEYFIDILAKLNRGTERLVLRSVGVNISKSVLIANILRASFGIGIDSVRTHELEIKGRRTSCLEIALRRTQTPEAENAANYETGSKFIEFPIYHLLLDWLLAQKGQIQVTTEEGLHLLTLVRSQWGMRCQRSIEKAGHDDQKISDRVVSACYRSGLLLSPSWYHVAQLLSEFDDVIIGVDTGILIDAVLSEQILSSLSLTNCKQYVHTPNWILLVIPSAVMHELEQAANTRDEKGSLKIAGRRGFRGLEEILDLDQSADVIGVSLTIVGETNPILDAGVELRGLREELSRREMRHEPYVLSSKLSTGDMIIRDQYKHFLKQIDFHKGVFFLTADKTSAALAKAEGLHSIYYKPPPWQAARQSMEPPRVTSNAGEEPISFVVPVGKLLYELAVEFGMIKIHWDKGEMSVTCDAKGESLDHWLFRRLRFLNARALETLFRDYAKAGGLSFSLVMRAWRELTARLYEAAGEEQ